MSETRLSFLQKFMAVLVIGMTFLWALPNVIPAEMRDSLPDFMPKQAMTLGLDLQGGAHLVLAVDVDDVLRHAYENLEDSIRVVARENKIYYRNLRTTETGVMLTLRDPGQIGALRDGVRSQNATVDETENGEYRFYFDDVAVLEMQRLAMQKTVQVLRGRVDEFGVAEPVVQQQGNDRVIVELPGVQDAARAKAAIGRTAQLTFHLVDENADPNGVLPAGTMRMDEKILSPDGTVMATRPLILQKRAALTGEMLTRAGASFDQNGSPAVDIAFDARGTRAFAKVSTENVGRRFAIVLDGQIYSSPVFREPILGGRAQISGSFTTPEAQDLSAILNAGALPAKVNVVEERTVGPTLGADSVAAGKLALGLGFALVLVFMVLFYGLFGLFANVALVINFVILLGVMSLFGFTLTLPGMAAMVLTLGMAVDANVLIFERIREEVASGKKSLSALVGGFEGAFSTIMDSNITTLIAAVVLFAIGSGPVKGFAVSLGIGICASMFTAITLTRWLCLTYYHARRPKVLPV